MKTNPFFVQKIEQIFDTKDRIFVSFPCGVWYNLLVNKEQEST